VVLVAVLVLAACGGDDGAAVDAGGAGDDELAPWCGDLEPLGPIAEGNLAGPENADDVVLGVIATYLDEHADAFAGDWIDREHGGTYVMAFTSDPEAHLQAILELPLDAATSDPASTDAPTGPVDLSGATTIAGEPLPPPEPPMTDAPPDTEGLDLTGTVGDSDTAIDTVLATYTVRELEALQDEAIDRLADADLEVFGVGQDTEHNRVHLDIEEPDDEARRLVGERFEVDAVCVSGSAAGVAPPTIDPSAPPTILPPEGADPQVTCGGDGTTFPLSAFDQPFGFEDGDHPLVPVLRESLTGEFASYVDASWRLLSEDDRSALVEADEPAVVMRFEWTGDRWIWDGGSGGPCQPGVVLPPGLGEASWELDPAFDPPGPDTTEVHVLVTELDCTSGSEIGDRLVGPEVRESDDQVVIAFAVIPPEGSAFDCQDNPPHAVTVELSAPLGNRVLADGRSVPPRPVS
jgi:hypothetical protein